MTFFTEFFTKLRENIDQLHQDRQQFYQNTREQINETAKQAKMPVGGVRQRFAGGQPGLSERSSIRRRSAAPFAPTQGIDIEYKDQTDDRSRKRPQPASRARTGRGRSDHGTARARRRLSC